MTARLEMPDAFGSFRCDADESVRDEDGETARDIAVAYGEAETQLYDQLSRNQP